MIDCVQSKNIYDLYQLYSYFIQIVEGILEFARNGCMHAKLPPLKTLFPDI
jgi:hypothetical protein